jgi:glycerol-3-phosphate dehydrogenase
MAQDMVDRVENIKGWKKTKSVTKDLKLHGYAEKVDLKDSLYFYGSDRDTLQNLIDADPESEKMISERLNIYKAQVIWAVRFEMARTVEDFLARRTRSILLDARESMLIAPKVADIMAQELGKDEGLKLQQIQDFQKVAGNYILH